MKVKYFRNINGKDVPITKKELHDYLVGHEKEIEKEIKKEKEAKKNGIKKNIKLSR